MRNGVLIILVCNAVILGCNAALAVLACAASQRKTRRDSR